MLDQPCLQFVTSIKLLAVLQLMLHPTPELGYVVAVSTSESPRGMGPWSLGFGQAASGLGCGFWLLKELGPCSHGVPPKLMVFQFTMVMKL